MIDAAAGFSDAGPRSYNEDAYQFWWNGSTFFAAVADGLGGLGGGGDASNYVIQFLRSQAVDEEISTEQLVELVLQAHNGLLDLQKERPEHRSMATTLTIMCVQAEKLIAAHCGDTRLYLARGNGIKRLSEDHSEGQRLFNEGLLSKRDLYEYPRKHILESALGVKDQPRVQKIEFDLQTDDWILIASDGAYGKLTSAEMRDIARSASDAEEFVATFQSLVEARSPTDNYTLVAAKVRM